LSEVKTKFFRPKELIKYNCIHAIDIKNKKWSCFFILSNKNKDLSYEK
jgi:hypothetical protein